MHHLKILKIKLHSAPYGWDSFWKKILIPGIFTRYQNVYTIYFSTKNEAKVAFQNSSYPYGTPCITSVSFFNMKRDYFDIFLLDFWVQYLPEKKSFDLFRTALFTESLLPLIILKFKASMAFWICSSELTSAMAYLKDCLC